MRLDRIWGGLRVRLAFLIFLALCPLGLIALWQTFRTVEEATALKEDALINATQIEAVGQRARIRQAVGAGQALGAMVRVSSTSACRAIMQEFVQNEPGFVFAGFVPISGIMTCSSAEETVLDFSEYETLQDAINRAEVYVEININGAVSQQNVMIVSVPVFDATVLQGFISLSMPMKIIRDMSRTQDAVTLIGIGTSGETFALNGLANGPDAYLPRGMSPADVVEQAGTNFRAQDQSGEMRMFSVTQTIGDSYVIVGSWPQAGLVSMGTWRLALAPLLFAALMWFASIAVSYLGLTRLVLQPLAELRSAMRRFALGERTAVGLDLENAPDEFKDAERAFNRMALLITEAEAQQMTDLHDKEVLLREVHHRVKNNLQMIASIMNLEARNAYTDEARYMLAGLQRRVRGLAMLHRSLYTQAETSRIDARDLVASVVSDTSAMLPETSVRIDTDLISVMLYPDQAVPLSMWVAEALTNAIKYVRPDASNVAFIRVDLTVDDAGMASISVQNSINKTAKVTPSSFKGTGLGTKLMTAFCRQLEGEDEIKDTGGQYAHTLRFRVQNFIPEADDGTTENAKAGSHTDAA